MIDVLAALDDRVLRAALAEPTTQTTRLPQDPASRPTQATRPPQATRPRRGGQPFPARRPSAPSWPCAQRGPKSGAASSSRWRRLRADRRRRAGPAGRAADAAAVGRRVGLRAIRVVYKIEHAERGRLAHCRISAANCGSGTAPRRGRGGPGSSRPWNGPLRRAGPRPAPPPPATSSGSGASPRPPSAPGSARPFPAGSRRQFPRPALESVVDPVDPRSAAGCSPPCRSWRRPTR